MVLRSRPLWNTVFLPLNFALTGWLSTLGAMLLVARWLPGGLGALPTALLQRLGLIAVGLLALCACAWLVAGLTGVEASFTAAQRLFELFPVWRLSLLGSMAAGVLVLVLLLRRHHTLASTWYSLMVAAVMLSTAWIFRWIIFMSVQGVPKYGAGLYIYHMPLGASGLLGIVGVFGLCVALISVITYVLGLFPGSNTHLSLTSSATI